MKQKRLFSFLLALALIIGLVVVPGTDASAAAKVKKLTLTKNPTVFVGASKQLTLKADGKNVTKKAKWSTSNKAVLAVKNGKITGKKAGVATVSAKFGGKTAKAKVTVSGLSTTKLKLKVGQTQKISFKKGTKAVSKGVTWASSNPNVVAVSNGVLTAKANGSAVITAKYQKKAFKCKVTVSAAGGSNDKTTTSTSTEEKKVEIKLSQTSATVNAGETVKLNLLEGTTDVTDKATWSTANTDVATFTMKKRDDINKVPAYCVVLGQYNGTTKITATYGGKTYDCTVTVQNAFDASKDLTVEYGTTVIHIDFDLKTDAMGNPDPAEVEELERQGCTVVGANVTKDQVCETATYKFKKLPKTLGEIKSLMSNPEKDDTVDSKETGKTNYGGFNAMAANICAACSYDATPNPADPLKGNDPVWDLFDYINGPAESMKISNATKQTAVSSMNTAHQAAKVNPYYSFFQGAKTTNGYTPSQPYTLVMYKGPYFIDKKQTITGTRPTTYMIFVPGYETTATDLLPYGVDSYGIDRYIDVYYSTKDKRWYSYQDQFMHVTANGFRTPEEEL